MDLEILNGTTASSTVSQEVINGSETVIDTPAAASIPSVYILTAPEAEASGDNGPKENNGSPLEDAEDYIKLLGNLPAPLPSLTKKRASYNANNTKRLPGIAQNRLSSGASNSNDSNTKEDGQDSVILQYLLAAAKTEEASVKKRVSENYSALLSKKNEEQATEGDSNVTEATPVRPISPSGMGRGIAMPGMGFGVTPADLLRKKKPAASHSEEPKKEPIKDKDDDNTTAAIAAIGNKSMGLKRVQPIQTPQPVSVQPGLPFTVKLKSSRPAEPPNTATVESPKPLDQPQTIIAPPPKSPSLKSINTPSKEPAPSGTSTFGPRVLRKTNEPNQTPASINSTPTPAFQLKKISPAPPIPKKEDISTVNSTNPFGAVLKKANPLPSLKRDEPKEVQPASDNTTTPTQAVTDHIQISSTSEKQIPSTPQESNGSTKLNSLTRTPSFASKVAVSPSASVQSPTPVGIKLRSIQTAPAQGNQPLASTNSAPSNLWKQQQAARPVISKTPSSSQLSQSKEAQPLKNTPTLTAVSTPVVIQQPKAPSGSSGNEKFIFSYEILKSNPPKECDRSKLEEYLADEEFVKIIGCSKDEFFKQPKWKQASKKKSVGLF